MMITIYDDIYDDYNYNYNQHDYDDDDNISYYYYKYSLKHEQQCFIGFKTRGISRVFQT